MLSSIQTYLQYCLPHHLISRAVGALADSQRPGIKKWMINFILKRYPVNMSEALQPDALAYASFNDFFTRALKPDCRVLAPDAKSIVSPADGCIAEIGSIHGEQLLQAKGLYYTLPTLLGDAGVAKAFENGYFATIYLAPHNYHRVHMPLSGRLVQAIYVPGRLFSVNRMTTNLVPNLYGRNERLVCLFETDAGLMAVILVGAMIVGSMQTVWMDKPFRASSVTHLNPPAITLEKGAELGRFTMGSTAIVLLPHGECEWLGALKSGDAVQLFQKMGSFK